MNSRQNGNLTAVKSHFQDLHVPGGLTVTGKIAERDFGWFRVLAEAALWLVSLSGCSLSPFDHKAE